MKSAPKIMLLLLTFAIALGLALNDSGVDQEPAPKAPPAVTVPLPVPENPPGELAAPEPLKGGPAPSTIQKNEDTQKELLPPKPIGGAQTYSCKQTFGGHLWSSRNGIKPIMFVVHYTAGNGTSEAIDAYFRRTRAASATFILEPRGHCLQEVPLDGKPWTQITANPYSISVEIVTTGYNVTRAQWLAMPIFSKHILADLMRNTMKFKGIPIRRVDPIGCNFLAGYTDHNALECGNDHTDVLPNFPWDVLRQQLASGPVSFTCTPRRTQRALNNHGARPKLTVDGQVGPKTKRAIKRFKAAHKLPADYHVGPKAGKLLGLKGCR